MYAEFLAEEFDITLPSGLKEKTSGAKLVNHVTKAILSRTDSASVQMLKEIREATEGSKLNVDSNIKTIDTSTLDKSQKDALAALALSNMGTDDE